MLERVIRWLPSSSLARSLMGGDASRRLFCSACRSKLESLAGMPCIPDLLRIPGCEIRYTTGAVTGYASSWILTATACILTSSLLDLVTGENVIGKQRLVGATS